MPTYRAQHCFQAMNGTSKDMYCNQFYLFHQTLSVTDLAPDSTPWGNALGASIRGFYEQTTGTTFKVSQFLNARINGGETVKFYDVADPPDSGARYTYANLTPLSTDENTPNLPEEVAVCLSYSALNSGFNRARRRGRIYIGPLNMQAASQGQTDRASKVSADFIQTLLQSALGTHAGLLAAGWHWRVFSTMDNLAFDISEYSVDNAFDTIRGRGAAPTERFSEAVA